ncbi:hypothetical protein D1AOALGA4SA_3901 [Olavius algarvensis Delta 1 endosymbiont]|nr:hypothetical protein D1AOALGA4SA_3901 [Olavius algarvensis Delta 1 endosymbiont]
MNVEHRTSNIEHRIMYSIYFKKTERSESIIRHSSFQCSFTRAAASGQRTAGLISKDPGPEDPALSSPQRGGVYLGLQME